MQGDLILGDDSWLLGSKPNLITPQRQLCAAIILQAWEDAFDPSSPAGMGTADDPNVVRGDARRFLTMTFGPWRDSREEICDLADINPDDLQRRATAKLKELRKDGELTEEAFFERQRKIKEEQDDELATKIKRKLREGQKLTEQENRFRLNLLKRMTFNLEQTTLYSDFDYFVEKSDLMKKNGITMLLNKFAKKEWNQFDKQT